MNTNAGFNSAQCKTILFVSIGTLSVEWDIFATFHFVVTSDNFTNLFMSTT